ncbi:hypothetical protein cand_024970 [Cryptosporidium andersoni]|uniref:t-SNARE coiled-coil homology domain-containing protein n=1 Tax=Cryptosporidium andersoni TaxID=117008 RepID=A0A1J4MAS9_9CRYT|nr:hypothetical protein cand_024970 [Cryptosporidium andersoni]
MNFKSPKLLYASQGEYETFPISSYSFLSDFIDQKSHLYKEVSKSIEYKCDVEPTEKISTNKYVWSNNSATDDDEALMEELLLDLWLLLAKLKERIFVTDTSDDKQSVINIIQVCISIGERLGNEIEKSCMSSVSICPYINRHFLIYSWFSYWKYDQLRNRISLRDTIIDKLQGFKIFSEVENKSTSRIWHKCDFYCARLLKYSNDFHILSKYANKLFNIALSLGIWPPSKQLYLKNINNKLILYTESNSLHCREEECQTLAEYSSSLEDLLLPELLCATKEGNRIFSEQASVEVNCKNESINGVSLIDLTQHGNFNRSSIIVEDTQYKSLTECKNKMESLRHSMVHIHEIQVELQSLLLKSTGEIDCIEEQTALAQMNSAQGVCYVAQGCKYKSKWWPFHGSTAGIVCGGAAGILLGPIGMTIGAAVGGTVGLTIGSLLRSKHESKMDEILKTCEKRRSKSHTQFKRQSSNIKDEKSKVIPGGSPIYLEKGHALTDSYNKYILKSSLSHIIDNCEIFPLT